MATGKYIEGIGRRKEAVARVRLTPSKSGEFLINDRQLEEYFPVARVAKSARESLLKLDSDKKAHGVSHSILEYTEIKHRQGCFFEGRVRVAPGDLSLQQVAEEEFQKLFSGVAVGEAYTERPIKGSLEYTGLTFRAGELTPVETTDAQDN